MKILAICLIGSVITYLAFWAFFKFSKWGKQFNDNELIDYEGTYMKAQAISWVTGQPVEKVYKELIHERETEEMRLALSEYEKMRAKSDKESFQKVTKITPKANYQDPRAKNAFAISGKQNKSLSQIRRRS